MRYRPDSLLNNSVVVRSVERRIYNDIDPGRLRNEVAHDICAVVALQRHERGADSRNNGVGGIVELESGIRSNFLVDKDVVHRKILILSNCRCACRLNLQFLGADYRSGSKHNRNGCGSADLSAEQIELSISAAVQADLSLCDRTDGICKGLVCCAQAVVQLSERTLEGHIKG